MVFYPLVCIRKKRIITKDTHIWSLQVTNQFENKEKYCMKLKKKHQDWIWAYLFIAPTVIGLYPKFPINYS